MLAVVIVVVILVVVVVVLDMLVVMEIQTGCISDTGSGSSASSEETTAQ